MPKAARKTTPSPAPYRPTARQADIAKQVAAAAAKAKQDAAALEAAKVQHALAQDLLAPAQKGSCGDGDLHLAFIPVGQGDCAIISTPKGRVVLFDCGSDSKEGVSDDEFRDDVRSVLKDNEFLKNKNNIDILITTHPDTDHYNQLRTVLEPTWTIDNWYFSAQRHQYAGGTSAFLGGLMSAGLGSENKVVLNVDPTIRDPGRIAINGTVVTVTSGSPTTPKLDGQGGIMILEEPNCQISILAADVYKEYTKDASNLNNRGSIVTLITVTGNGRSKDKKVLMCGDATRNTEQFLLNTARARIKDLDVLQAGHHGSINTSCLPEFVTVTNPAMVVASAGKQIVMHRLPSKKVILDYRAQLKSSGQQKFTPHLTYYWPPVGAGNVESSLDEYKVFTTGSFGQAIRVTL